MLKVFYNRQLFCGRNVVENSFGILSKMLRELLQNTNLNVFFFLDVVCCYILHNLILNGKDENLESLMTELEVENHEQLTQVVRRVEK